MLFSRSLAQTLSQSLSKPTRSFSKLCERSPLEDGISRISILSGERSDLTVVNAARVSFDRESQAFTTIKDRPKFSDEALLNFLARDGHWTPFAHPSFAFTRYLPAKEFIQYCQRTEKYQFDRHVYPITGDTVYFIERGSAFAYISTCIDAAQLIKRHEEQLHPHPFCFEMDPIYHIGQKMPYTLLAFSKARQVVWPNALRNDTLRRCREIAYTHLPSGKETDSIATLSFRIKMPIFVERQWFKHTIGFIRSSVSRRYVRDTPDFHYPTDYRLQDANIKQGSSSDLVSDDQFLTVDDSVRAHTGHSIGLYEKMREVGVCAEQARIVYPQNMYTEFIETGTVDAYKRLLHLRLAKSAQKEIQQYARCLLELVSDPGCLHHSRFEEFKEFKEFK